jgi:hypothetical protein
MTNPTQSLYILIPLYYAALGLVARRLYVTLIVARLKRSGRSIVGYDRGIIQALMEMGIELLFVLMGTALLSVSIASRVPFFLDCLMIVAAIAAAVATDLSAIMSSDYYCTNRRWSYCRFKPLWRQHSIVCASLDCVVAFLIVYSALLLLILLI